MTSEQDKYFNELTKDRTENAQSLEKPSMRGIKKSVVEKYSDQAHFIYELLQNADDAGASFARFVLHEDKLVFAHNGTRHFSITDPKKEDEDSENGTLGDINAITSIANSNKDKESSIGKFGVGFKSVFQYTDTPHIYDSDIRFRIERFIVPKKLNNDFDGRKPYETLFVFPFNRQDITKEEAYEDISDKLRNLSYPILFLNKLNIISLLIEGKSEIYSKTIEDSRIFSETKAKKIRITQIHDDVEIWLFSRKDSDGRKYSIGFFLDENGNLQPKQEPAFCFFPTKESTGLKFLIHAPFLLTDSRESIRAGVPHNKEMINLLADLAADSLVFLRDIGIEKSVQLINDDILNIIPIDEYQFNDIDDNQNILFLPIDGDSDYITINRELMEDENTVKFIKDIGVKEPSLKDEIYNKIIPKYKNNKQLDIDAHFKKFFRYYEECRISERSNLINLIKECPFIRSNSYKEENNINIAKNLYFSTNELKEFFETKKETLFINLEYYKNLIDYKYEESDLDIFFSELGVSSEPKILEHKYDFLEAINLGLFNKERLPRSTKPRYWYDRKIDGCDELLDYISKNNSYYKSITLWNQLLKIENLESKLSSTLKYFYKKEQSQSFESSTTKKLKTIRWLFNNSREICNVKNISVQTLSDDYDKISDAAKKLIDFLGIVNEEENLSEEQRRKIKLADKLEKAGITEEELNIIIRQRQQKKLSNKINNIQSIQDTRKNTNNETDDIDNEINNISNSTSKRVIKEIIKRTKEKPSYSTEPENDFVNDDEDEYIRPSINYSDRIEKAKEKSAKEIERITHLEELQQKASNFEKYSFGWFASLLELETLNSNENNLHNREISISFAKVELEADTTRTLILRHPNRYIPQFMEDLADIPLVLHMGSETKKVAIEVVNVKSYTLRVKLKTNAGIEDVDLSAVTEARIEAQNPVFLLEELRKQFLDLKYDDNYNLQKNLPENIEFIFGPPGTGKTTYLAKNTLIPLMQKNNNLKILVLTPTNKAADVLVSKIVNLMENDTSYNNWLIRFGTTNDENIEQSEIFREKTFDIRTLPHSVTVTTIARFPYDFFMPNGERLFLREINWDYIVIDEASMIPIAEIAYPLYKKTPRKFIVAGDPFQIEPISSVNTWKDENIYTMVKLNSFTKPKTIPHQYKVEPLTTQYRSIPEIGDIFSKFAYGGILKHHRNSISQRKLNIEKILPIKTINLIKFPVSKYESIYRPKRLKGTSTYHIYSALFSFEFINYLAPLISKENKKEKFKIGIIAPYKAQADLIDRLSASANLPDKIDVQVGTIHGYQGDECDIIIAVLNAPPNISKSTEMFLNKRNIINVSISRAKDYLFIIMPDNNTENIDNLFLVKRVEELIKEKGNNVYAEFNSHDVEKIIFDNPNYIEENSFSTSHHNVNVYGLPEKLYEIRNDESAVDIQIHKKGN